MEIWQNVGSVLSVAEEGSESNSQHPSSSQHTLPQRPPPVAPRPSGSPRPSASPTSNRAVASTGRLRWSPPPSTQQLSELKQQDLHKQIQLSSNPTEFIGHKEAEMERFVIDWMQDMLHRLGESSEECPLATDALAESLSRSIAGLSTIIADEKVKDVVRHHMLQLAGLT